MGSRPRWRWCCWRPAAERTPANKRAAVSYAAFRALADLFPARLADFQARLRALGYDPADRSTDLATAAGVGNVAAAVLLGYRHGDGANQLGDLAPGAYADWTGYQPVNTPDQVTDPGRWQPLRLPDGTVQRFPAPQLGRVEPFALRSGGQFRPPRPPAFAGRTHRAEVDELVGLSARLDDRAKAVAEYWSDGPAGSRPGARGGAPARTSAGTNCGGRVPAASPRDIHGESSAAPISSARARRGIPRDTGQRGRFLRAATNAPAVAAASSERMSRGSFDRTAPDRARRYANCTGAEQGERPDVRKGYRVRHSGECPNSQSARICHRYALLPDSVGGDGRALRRLL